MKFGAILLLIGLVEDRNWSGRPGLLLREFKYYHSFTSRSSSQRRTEIAPLLALESAHFYYSLPHF